MILSTLAALFVFFLRITLFLGGLILSVVGAIIFIAMIISWILKTNRREDK